MTGGKAVPSGASAAAPSALRGGARPPIPADADPADQPVRTAADPRPAVPAVRADGLRGGGQDGGAQAQPSGVPASRSASRPDSLPASRLPDVASGWVAGMSEEQLAALTPGTMPGPPPQRQRVRRVQLNSKIEEGLDDRVRGFTVLYGSTLQAVLEAALVEYMDVRGYTDEFHRRRGDRR